MQGLLNKLRVRSAAQNEVLTSRTRKMGWAQGLTATLVSVLAVGLSPAMAEAQVTLDIGDTATLAAKGSAVILPVKVTCGPGTTGWLSAQLTQRAGNRIAQGYGSTSDIVCDGTPQTVDLFITAQNQPFKKGPAVARAYFFFCDEFTCQSISKSEEITIVR